ncbi:hypothetical protein HJC23_005553 [Cyclotella cryptica]|uniref:Uncharacterized protein n=1 Tax=Cyclotella cryptica TaxID=29204 RepID=A0ABD3PX74_9STRA
MVQTSKMPTQQHWKALHQCILKSVDEKMNGRMSHHMNMLNDKKCNRTQQQTSALLSPFFEEVVVNRWKDSKALIIPLTCNDYPLADSILDVESRTPTSIRKVFRALA